MRASATITEAPALDWANANQAYLAGELGCLRLRLQRRVLWLRQQWQPDPLRGYQEVVSDQQADWLLVGEELAEEQRFYEQDEKAAAISRDLRAAETRQQDQLDSLDQVGTPPGMTVLNRLFGLNEFEQQVLLLCLAPELDPGLADLYAYVQDHVGRRYATPHLAVSLFSRSEEERWWARNSFLPEAPLRRFALLKLASTPSPSPVAYRPLQLPSRVADFIRGVNRPDAMVADLLQPVVPAPVAAEQAQLVESVLHWLEARSTGPTVFNLVGRPGIGRQAVAQSICARLSMQLYQLKLARLDQSDLLPLLLREAALSGWAYYLDLAELLPGQESSVRDLIERLEAMLFVASEERWPAERETMLVRVPKPGLDEQRLLWQQVLAHTPHQVDGAVNGIVQQFDLGPQAIVKAVSAAQNLSLLRTAGQGGVVSADDLWQACREQSGPQLAQLARRIIPVYTWEDIVLPDDLLQQLRELAAQVSHRHQVYQTWGFGARLSRGRGISALFAGPSGTGKTMAAEILASDLHLDLYRIDLAGVVSKYIGETEKNLKQVFDAAEQSGAILFFDEADALFGKRTEVKDSHDRYANIEVNYLLQRMEDYRGLAILATNRKSALDQAFLRRLRFLLDFPFPNVESRRHIWQKVFPPETPLEELDWLALARLEIPGGNIINIALGAAFLAADQGQAVGMAQVMRAARREYGKIGKLLKPAEFGDYFEMVQA